MIPVAPPFILHDFSSVSSLLSRISDKEHKAILARSHVIYSSELRYCWMISIKSINQSIKLLYRQYPRRSQAQWCHSRIGGQQCSIWPRALGISPCMCNFLESKAFSLKVHFPEQSLFVITKLLSTIPLVSELSSAVNLFSFSDSNWSPLLFINVIH